MKKIVTILAFVSLVFASQSAEELIKNNGCLSCHGINTVKKAPPFAGIAMRNSRRSSDPKGDIMYSIKNGSEGKYRRFAGEKMPSYSNLSLDELSILADWILKQKPNHPMGRGRGRGMGRGMM